VRALELYAGIGGFSAAARGIAETIAAIEQSNIAANISRINFSHPVLEKNICGLRPADLEKYDADLWWMSPPCQPYTSRGKNQDLDDPRAKSFVQVLQLIEAVQPKYLGLENVPGFQRSRAREALLAVLQKYELREELLCPTRLGVPNRRERYYLVASRVGLSAEELPRAEMRPLVSYLEQNPGPDLQISEVHLERYRHAMSILDPHAPENSEAVASCFTSAYGRSPAESGSFLNDRGSVRRFSPREVLALLGFPPEFRVEAPPVRAYALIGNSLSIPAVRAMLRLFPPC
jgi:site-specific DNA-cytosine methylase